MKVMAVDYGDTRTGIALSDITGTLVGETTVIKAYNEENALEGVLAFIESRKPEVVVVGYPKNMNGTIGPRAEKSERFAAALRESSGLRVELRDERLTTVDAHRILTDAGKHGKKRKETVDAVAASLILEGFLAECR